jgi:hypothetical protein
MWVMQFQEQNPRALSWWVMWVMAFKVVSFTQGILCVGVLWVMWVMWPAFLSRRQLLLYTAVVYIQHIFTKFFINYFYDHMTHKTPKTLISCGFARGRSV